MFWRELWPADGRFACESCCQLEYCYGVVLISWNGVVLKGYLANAYCLLLLILLKGKSCLVCRPFSSPKAAAAAAAAAARLRRKIVSGHFDEENPFVLILSVLLVQADEGVPSPVVDLIDDIYRNLPRRADVIVTTVGARHKCQQAAAAAAAAAARLRRKIVSGHFDEENPFVLILSVLLVQADEGVSFLVVDRIGDIYRNLPRRADVIVTTVGARHKCQQGFGSGLSRTAREVFGPVCYIGPPSPIGDAPVSFRQCRDGWPDFF
ncbi:hypothetical protein F511_34372 [Dorcoceras hygrometricum]|uniref:Uncharacterized protein n=1 Tax=Dorcoceras hygrometricum TaxID=472368 RepID=A0A2Z7BES2_9LAMI|nr:hypothetical protein F511_34372 [Dorcoceras hygrometricum]